MIRLDRFFAAHHELFGYEPDNPKTAALAPPASEPLFLVAGPGTGKTAALTLRVLKLILVDDIPPNSILATTFTNKAAAELRSRVLAWGFRLLEVLQKDAALPQPLRDQLSTLDMNQVTTGTIDSISEALLRDHREPGTHPPIIADQFVSDTILLRDGLLDQGRYQDDHLDSFLLRCSGRTSTFGWNLGAKVNVLKTLWDRRCHDQVDWSSFIASGPASEQPGRQKLDDALKAYSASLAAREMVDFVQLEQRVLDGLRAGLFDEFTDRLRVVLVDEYQDSNLLQEQIYFELARACDGALTVVGDDDQSLYRFRGATVELFRDFETRYESVFGRRPARIFLATSYRSTQVIVDFISDYAELDPVYQEARVNEKPRLQYGREASAEEVPVLGLFRENVDDLANDLAGFVHSVFRGGGYAVPGGGVLQCAPQHGDVGDCAFLASSPQEYAAGGKARLPRHFREALEAREIAVFNPRGEDLTEIPVIERFGGLLLECLDPVGVIEGDMRGIADDVRTTFASWRNRAVDFVETEAPAGLSEYATGWADRDPQRVGYEWPRSTSALDLVYGLAHFFPDLHDDPEGQVYLECFTRQLAACEQIGKFKARVVHDPGNDGLAQASVRELLRDFLEPIASGTTKINEDLIEAFPHDRLSILSIHQAKGLEFPLVLVDVGADFKSNHHTQAFKRFPRNPGGPQVLEDLIRAHTPLGRPARSDLDRAFDDLYRQYFVAFSRPRQVLLVTGLTAARPSGGIPNVAMGWRRSGESAWRDDFPFVEI